MKPIFSISKLSAILIGASVFAMSGQVLALDAAAAEKLARQEGCLRCHGIDRAKDGPAYKEIAAKHKGKAGIESELLKHLSSGRKVKFEDGHEEEHKIPKTKDEAQLRNLIQWILSL